jgi:AcrR family transcriptional regulator
MTPEAGATTPPDAWQAAGERILDAAVRCMGRYGMKVSMQVIATEAGTSRGAVYRHFAGRSALVDAVLERTAGVMLDSLAQPVDAHGRLAAQVAEAIRSAPDSQPEPLATALRDAPVERAAWLADRWRDFWRPRLAAAQRRGEVRDDLALDDAADWITRLQLSFVSSDPHSEPFDDLDHYVHEHLMRGLAAS